MDGAEETFYPEDTKQEPVSPPRFRTQSEALDHQMFGGSLDADVPRGL